jgi:UDP-N-acetylmuramoyl-L-alanyl-D-glutamate--2,6-diaminopimelate ligase
MEERRPAGNTTPQSLEVQEMLRAMLDAGCKRAVMEVSSHGLALDRVADIEFGAAVFTNLSRDHLDFHGSLAAYREVKASFFRRSGPYGESRVAVVNLDDPVGREIVAATELDRITFGVEEEADVRARLLRADLAGTRVRLQIGREARETTLQLVGRFNASNAAAAAGAAHALGVGIDRIAEGLASLPAVPGRMETVRAGQPFTVIVDYAHTPDALERLLTAVREMARGPVTLVFGCGGDRDRGKRPIMGGVAARLAERVIVTNDNPRSEDPQEIVDAILAGMSDREIDGGARGARHAPEVTLDRAEAIDLAVRECGDDGVVVVAGKGHEDYQIVGGERRAFDDRDAVRGSLRALGHSGGGKSGK